MPRMVMHRRQSSEIVEAAAHDLVAPFRPKALGAAMAKPSPRISIGGHRIARMRRPSPLRRYPALRAHDQRARAELVEPDLQGTRVASVDIDQGNAVPLQRETKRFRTRELGGELVRRFDPNPEVIRDRRLFAAYGKGCDAVARVARRPIGEGSLCRLPV